MPAVTSETAIANIALTLLGEAPVQSLDDDAASARTLKLNFAVVRQTLLRSHSFSFARVSLDLVKVAPTPAGRYDFAYGLPNDYIRSIALNPDETMHQESFVIEDSLLWTDSDAARLLYIKDVLDVTKYDAAFVDALANKLAAKCCRVITGSEEKLASLTKEFIALSLPTAEEADASDGNAELPWQYRESRLVKSRRNSALG